jgi:hypothetical protein
MIDEKMYKILSNLDSEELSRRITEDELTEQGFEVASKILVERGQKIPNRTKQPNNSPDDSFINSFKRFAKERPILTIIIISFVLSVLLRLFVIM